MVLQYVFNKSNSNKYTSHITKKQQEKGKYQGQRNQEQRQICKKGNSNMSTSREFQPYSELRETALESILYQMGSTDLT